MPGYKPNIPQMIQKQFGSLVKVTCSMFDVVCQTEMIADLRHQIHLLASSLCHSFKLSLGMRFEPAMQES